MTSVPILMFHQVTPTPDAVFRKYAITPEVFALQLDWIARNGFTPVRLRDIFGNMRKRSLPRRPIAITFDDGFQGCYEHAVPALLARQFTATFFVVAGLVGKRSEWLLRERGVEYEMMNWNSLRELTGLGFECGSHTLTHPRLADLTRADCRMELGDSRSLLEHGLGLPVTHLAYPFGSFSDSVRSTAFECGYESACTVRPGVAREDDDALTLLRIPVNGTDAPLAFAGEIQKALHPRLHETVRIARRLWCGLVKA